MLKISVILTTYNRPIALKLVLQALAAQTQPPFEVIIADDGSTSSTFQQVQQIKPLLPYFLQYIWQEDDGFRAAQARNRAAAVAQGHYFIFLDGDCLPQTDFIFQHQSLAEKGYFVVGHRVLLNHHFTTQVLEQQIPLWTWSLNQWLLSYLHRDINRLLPLIRLPLPRKYNPQKWQGAKTCNLAVWRSDFFKINGFNESFQGWGHEDAEFVVRLLRSGLRRKEGQFAVPVLHLWHHQVNRDQEPQNRQRLENNLQSVEYVAQKGVNQYFSHHLHREVE